MKMWSGFFDPATVLEVFGLHQGIHDLVEFGCGYGTFTLAAGGIASGTVHALDIEPEMVEVVRGKCREAGISPEQCIAWGREAGFLFNEQNRYDLPPYHYGLLFRKPTGGSP